MNNQTKTPCRITSENSMSPPSSFSIEYEWLNTTDAATYLRISVGSLRNMTSNGQVPHCKLGRRNRYRKDELRDFLLSQKRGGF